MHLYLLTRGIINQVELFITHLRGKFLKIKLWENGKLVEKMLPIAVRPIQLWEVIFPEEHRELVCHSILGPAKGNGTYKPKKMFGLYGGKTTQHKKHEKFLWALRKGLGIEAIAPYESKEWLPMSTEDVEIIGLGTKKDYWIDKDGKKHNHNKDNQCQEGL